jgi:hypothetical protein
MHPHEANDQVLVQHVLKLPPYGTRNMWKLQMHKSDLSLL